MPNPSMYQVGKGGRISIEECFIKSKKIGH